MKTNKILVTFALLFFLTSCGPSTAPTESEYQPVNDLERVFQSMQKNNFTVDMNSSFVNNNNAVLNRKVYYTDYSIEQTGDYGFSGYAQKDDVVFRYSYLENDVVTGSPMINSNTGLRYTSLYEYKKSMQNFNISDLPDQKDSDGYYSYKWGENLQNDNIMLEVFHAIGSNSFPPLSTKLKVIGNTIECKSVILEYWEDDNGNMLKDTIETFIYDIGSTENNLIKNYLESNGSYKMPLDNRFFRTINSYLLNENYTAELEAIDILNSQGVPTDLTITKYMSPNAVMYEYPDRSSGYFMHGGVANSFTIINDKFEITGTPYADSEYNFFTGIVGQIESLSFSSLDHSLFVGYKSETNENSYILSDSYLMAVLSDICLITLSEYMHADFATFTIVNEEKNEFDLTINYYNKITNVDAGTLIARFRNHKTTSISEVERYLFKGENPQNQEKEELIDVLEQFKNGNYSYDAVTSAGLTKYYYTENYMLAVPYTSYLQNNNYGFMKYNGGIYMFNANLATGKITIDETVDYSKGENAMELPGTGSLFFGSDDDLGYVSHLTDEIYDYDNYVIDYQNGQYYWKNESSSFSTTCFNYFKTYTNILPTGSGFIVNSSDNSYDTRVTLISNFISNDGIYTGQYEFTYYDIGNTYVECVEDFLNA